jgi:hypothetical protein
VREAAEGYVTILNGCCRFLRKQNRTRTSRKEGMKKERETVKRKENERERERERVKITLCFNTVVCDAF